MARIFAVLLFALTGCVSHRLDFRAQLEEPLDPPPAVFSASVALRGPMTDASVAPLVAVFEANPAHVTMTIDSPGGSVGAGLDLVDAMRAAQRSGTRITCVTDGWAASMAAYTFQACDVRLMTRQSAVMFHTVSVQFASGNQYDFERLARKMAGVNKMLAVFIAGRMGMPIAEYEARVTDRDWWLGWEEALAAGAADGVL